MTPLVPKMSPVLPAGPVSGASTSMGSIYHIRWLLLLFPRNEKANTAIYQEAVAEKCFANRKCCGWPGDCLLVQKLTHFCMLLISSAWPAGYSPLDGQPLPRSQVACYSRLADLAPAKGPRSPSHTPTIQNKKAHFPSLHELWWRANQCNAEFGDPRVVVGDAKVTQILQRCLHHRLPLDLFLTWTLAHHFPSR